ncbi:putative pre-rRNA processing protein [Aspergillus candidus]|uniref:rRNA biogenesis protein RRP36 n=1 Tax=Aspergillus candidus TaxID=41067 RepID=A0A2I2EYY8_ASPCN|nr:rRNA biogenesis protein rrp36 [Aspergillus candidus]PLB33578.1 rRNA biogenesis protein rrp36 [Aspergillus candidus]
MAISDLLNRRMQARPDDDEEVYSEGSGSENSANGSDSDDSDNSDNAPSASDMESDLGEEDEESDDASEGDSSPPKEADDFQSSLNSISFGALAKAQASLGPKSKRTKQTAEAGKSEDSPLDDIRARIREAREQKRTASSSSSSKGKYDSEKKQLSRSSKHAPAVQTSKRAVSRKRTVVEPPAIQKSRDPRFDPTVLSQGGGQHNPEAALKAYAFLDEYRSAELKEMKEKLRRTKNPAEKEALQRSIRSAADRERAIANRRREKDVVAEHKKREKQLIREGKKSNPYFLKNSEMKKQVLLKKYDNMNSKERTKALERRRKKVASKERKQMPMDRRGLDDGGAEEPRKRRRMD